MRSLMFVPGFDKKLLKSAAKSEADILLFAIYTRLVKWAFLFAQI